MPALLLGLLLTACPQRAAAAYTALYGSDGNDFVGFTGGSGIAGLKTSGWNGLIMWALSVQTNGDITYNNDTVTLAHNGVYVGPAAWGANVAALKSPPTTVTRFEAALGGVGDNSFANIKSLVAAQGTGTGSILYKNFQALKKAVPGLDAINDDDESTYDLSSSTTFGLMINGLGCKLSLAPYQNESFWVQLRRNLGAGCDIVYLQCYSGGAGNNPGTWDAAFGSGFHVTPGIDSNLNGSSVVDWEQWAAADQVASGFYWPDIGWSPSASWGPLQILDGLAMNMPAPVPTGLQAAPGYGLINLGWAPCPSATNYTVTRSTISGMETTIASTTNSYYADTKTTNGVTYFYMVFAQNTKGPSGNSSEVMAAPGTPIPGSYAAALVGDHPLAYWPLNETSGPVAFDPVGGHNGSYVGGVTLGQAGVPLPGFASPTYSVLFDGVSSYADIPEGPFNFTNAMTTVAWVKVAAAPPNFSGIIGHGDSSWRLSINTSGEPGAADGGSGDATSAASITGSGWHMVAYTYTGVPNAANNGSLYVDGSLAAHDTVGVPAGDALDVWIGGAPDYGTSRLMPGGIAQAAVFTTALSAAQVLALYRASMAAPPVTLKISPTGAGNVTVNWSWGMLLQATNMTGPWTTNTATSPYTFTMPANSQMFFRVLAN